MRHTTLLFSEVFTEGKDVHIISKATSKTGKTSIIQFHRNNRHDDNVYIAVESATSTLFKASTKQGRVWLNDCVEFAERRRKLRYGPSSIEDRLHKAIDAANEEIDKLDHLANITNEWDF